MELGPQTHRQRQFQRCLGSQMEFVGLLEKGPHLQLHLEVLGSRVLEPRALGLLVWRQDGFKDLEVLGRPGMEI